MSREIELWQHVADDRVLLERAALADPGDVAAVTRLRRDYSVDAVTVALELCTARAKAVAKFGESAAQIIADVQGVEQASGSAVARHKARRIRETLGEGAAITDLCCGIGGDSMALVEAGLAVVSVDRDPLRAWMAGHNTGGLAAAVCADAGQYPQDDAAIHIDPARRDEAAGRRAWRLDDYQPDPDTLGRLIDQAQSAAVKLSPGIDLDALPWPGEVEFISDAGRLVQAVLWAGGFARSARSATLIDTLGTHTLAGEPTPIPLDTMRRYLFAIDPSVERSGLIGLLSQQVQAKALHRKLGLLTSDRVIDSPWLTGFERVERMAWRPKRVKQWLADHDGGIVEVKTRGKACNPDHEQQQLRGKGTTTYTVFVLRFDTKVEALITRRL